MRTVQGVVGCCVLISGAVLAAHGCGAKEGTLAGDDASTGGICGVGASTRDPAADQCIQEYCCSSFAPCMADDACSACVTGASTDCGAIDLFKQYAACVDDHGCFNGGKGGSAGTAGAGGSAGKGGMSGNGGSAGKGGTAGSGGAAGKGGSTGTGGSGGCVGACTPGATENQPCGNCGTQTHTCTASCQWGSWGTCTGEGPCTPAQTETQPCGNCGSQLRSCDGSCTWGTWGTCSGQGACAPGQTQSEKCGNCGTHSQTCTSSCGWPGWSACTGEGCAPGSTSTSGCGACQIKTCNSSCTYGACTSTCTTGQTCYNGSCKPNGDLPLKSWNVRFCDTDPGDGWDSNMTAIIRVNNGITYWSGTGDCEFNTSCSPEGGSFTGTPQGSGLTINMLLQTQLFYFQSGATGGKSCFDHMILEATNYFGHSFTLSKQFAGGSTCAGNTCVGSGAGCTSFNFSWAGTPNYN